MEAKLDTTPGQSIYSHLTLKIYDLILMISNRYAWKCTTKTQLAFFNKNISNCHLDVGVGSGYYLKNCNFPNPKNVQLTLMDLNVDCLIFSANKLRQYIPQLLQQDIYQPFTNYNKYDSISLNYVLHCLPGDLNDKQIVFNNLKKLLTVKGSIFGATILGNKVKPNWLAKNLLKIYNKKQIFCNSYDCIDELNRILNINFNHVEIIKIGMVALFKVSKPIY